MKNIPLLNGIFLMTMFTVISFLMYNTISFFYILSAVFIAFLLSQTFLTIILKSKEKAISECIHDLRQIQSGQLKHIVNVSRKDEMGEIQKNIRTAQVEISRSAADLKKLSDTLSSSLTKFKF